MARIKYQHLRASLLNDGTAFLHIADTTMSDWKHAQAVCLEAKRVERAMSKWAKQLGLKLRTRFDKETQVLKMRLVK